MVKTSDEFVKLNILHSNSKLSNSIVNSNIKFTWGISKATVCFHSTYLLILCWFSQRYFSQLFNNVKKSNFRWFTILNNSIEKAFTEKLLGWWWKGFQYNDDDSPVWNYPGVKSHKLKKVMTGSRHSMYISSKVS